MVFIMRSDTIMKLHNELSKNGYSGDLIALDTLISHLLIEEKISAFKHVVSQHINPFRDKKQTASLKQFFCEVEEKSKLYSHITFENTTDSLKLTMNNHIHDDHFLEYVLEVTYPKTMIFYRNEGQYKLYKRHKIEFQQSQLTYTQEETIQK